MSKERISATVDEDVSEFLSQDHINTSGLVNNLVQQYMDGGNENGAILRLREEQLRSELESLEQRQEMKRSELERIRESREAVEAGPNIADTADELLDDMEADGMHVWPDCEPVSELARENNTDPSDIMAMLKRRAADQERDILHTQFERADMVRGTTGRPIAEVVDDE